MSEAKVAALVALPFLGRMNNSVAVVIPNYNDAKSLPRSVRSVMNQDVAADEVVVVDDCSTDDSMETIRALATEFPTLRVIRHEVNQGVYGAIATGRAATSSEYVMFVAANDFLLQGLMARAKDCLASHPGVGLWSSMGWLVDEEDQLLGPIAITVPSMHDQYFSPVQCREL
ncbi:MAG: glycosyltransferase family 2 protein, partial [Cytophaga sp.]|nr:glycosyltransferase family 2 protein [Undibacterium sp.]